MALNNLTRIGNSGFGTDTSINTTGIVTAASFSGDGSALTGITALGSGVVVQEEGSNVGTAQTINFIGTGVTATFSGGIASIEIATSGGGGGGLSDIVSDTTPQLGGNLDVNGKDITGTGGVNLTGVVTATTFVGALTGNASGNAATATTLENARTIGGVSFDGSANINLPGVNAAGNQDTSGTASIATNVTVANEASDTECFVMFGVNATGNNAPKSSSSLKYNSSSGGLSAGSFIGDGSGLTGITASGSGVIVRDGGSLVGTAGTIDFGSNVSVSPISAGVVTVTASAGSIPGINTSLTTQLNNLTVAGVSTFNNFETLGAGVTVTGTTFSNQLNVSGISTFAGTLNLDNGSTNVLSLASDSSQNSVISQLGSGLLSIKGTNNNGVMIHADHASGQIILRNGTGVGVVNRLSTTATGVTVTGTLTATTFSGSGASLTTLNASELDSGTIPDARFPATLPAASGANLTNLPAANITGTLPAISGANLTNLPSDTPADTDVQVTYDVSSNGSSGYRFTGPGYSGADDNPDIYLVRGQRYRFINGTGSGHPFRIQSDTSGTAYTDGVSGSQSGTQDFNVQHDAPVRLYYQCTIHSGMIGNIYIVGASDWRMTDVATNATPDIFTNLNVGIGTDNPSEKLHIQGDIRLVDNSPRIGFHDANAADNLSCTGGIELFDKDGNRGAYMGATEGSGFLSFGISPSAGAAPTEKLRITSAGLVGIGTNSPGAILEVFDATSNTIVNVKSGDAGAVLNLIDNSARSSIEQNGTTLKISSDTGAEDASSDIRLQVDGSTRVSIDSNGRTNISDAGITNDDFQLQVESNASRSAAKFYRTRNTAGGGLIEIFDDVGGTETRQFHFATGGNLTLDKGNLVIGTSGQGIDFSATGNGSGTMTSELLDDYEEGTWTPTGNNNFNTITNAVGRYVKVGDIVFLTFQFNFSSLDSASSSSAIVGLPYSPANTNPNTGIEATGICYGNSLQLQIYIQDSPNLSFETNAPLQGSTNTSANFYRGSITYRT